MRYDTAKGHRRTTRLKGYDYASPGAYFVTICVKHRECLFGQVVDGRMQLSVCGKAAADCWAEIPAHFPVVALDEFVVMPNHVHGILVIRDIGFGVPRRGVQLNAPTVAAPTGDSVGDAGNPFSSVSPRRNTLGVLVRTYKAAVTTACHQAGQTEFAWQRNYHDHIIRNPRDLDAIRRYIQNNPARWTLDRDNLDNSRRLSPPRFVDDYLTDIDWAEHG